MNKELTMGCNQVLNLSGKIRELLCRNNFYSGDKLEYLSGLFYQNINESYISSIKIDYYNKSVHIQFKPAYIRKQNMQGNRDSLMWYGIIYNILIQFYNSYKADIMSIIGPSNMVHFANPSLFHGYFFISRVSDNAIMIQFA